MAWQKCSIQLILGLPLAMPIVSYAIEVGDTYIESGQNQPLNASMNVTNIDPATFSVKLANTAIYRQMGLSADHPISIRFQPTSSNGGKIILTSTLPIATPYADVILDIQNKGEKKVLPKTLLMPLGNNPITVVQAPTPAIPARESTKVIIASSSKIELPSTSPIPVNDATVTPKFTTETTLPNSIITYKSDNLVIQETKGSSSLSAEATTTSTIPKSSATVPSFGNKALATDTVEETQVTAGETVTYVIQRNENLWTIANRVAKGTKKDVHTVMQEIIDQNPNAFENDDPTKIVANTKLILPKYTIVPSQTGIKAAAQVRVQAGKARKPVSIKTAAKPTAESDTTKKSIKSRQRYPTAKPKYMPPAAYVSRPQPPKTQMVIVAPQHSSGSAQGDVKTITTTTKVVNPQVINQLEQKRQATATQAAKVNQLNNNISSSEQKIKIQNQKLAELEQRLKALNKK